VRVTRAVTIFGTVTLAFVGSPHSRVAGLLRRYSCWARHGGRSTGSLRPAFAINESRSSGEEDDDARRYPGTSERRAIRNRPRLVGGPLSSIGGGALGYLEGFGRLRRRLQERFDRRGLFTLITRPTRPSWPRPLIIYCVDWTPADWSPCSLTGRKAGISREPSDAPGLDWKKRAKDGARIPRWRASRRTRTMAEQNFPPNFPPMSTQR
jgi:hypothetical protein